SGPTASCSARPPALARSPPNSRPISTAWAGSGLEPEFLRWKPPALCSGEAIRQERREERCHSPSVERRDTAGARQNATRRAGVFCAVGSSKLSPVGYCYGLRASPAHVAKSLRRRQFHLRNSGSRVP